MTQEQNKDIFEELDMLFAIMEDEKEPLERIKKEIKSFIRQTFVSRERIEEWVKKNQNDDPDNILIIGKTEEMIDAIHNRGYNQALSDLRRELLEEKEK